MLEHEPPTAMLQLAECAPDQPLEEAHQQACLIQSLGARDATIRRVPRDDELAIHPLVVH